MVNSRTVEQALELDVVRKQRTMLLVHCLTVAGKQLSNIRADTMTQVGKIAVWMKPCGPSPLPDVPLSWLFVCCRRGIRRGTRS